MATPRTIHEYRNTVLSADGPDGPLARLVAVTLSQFMDSKTLETIVGVSRIAETSGLCERTVRTELRALRVSGWLTERSKGPGHPVIRCAITPAPRAALPRQDVPGVTPANGAGNPGTALPDTPAPRAAYLDQNLEKSLGAAPPSPADAGFAAQETESDRRKREAIEREQAWEREKQSERSAEEALRTGVDRLLRAGKSDEEILAEIGGGLTAHYLQHRRELRQRMPFLAKPAVGNRGPARVAPQCSSEVKP